MNCQRNIGVLLQVYDPSPASLSLMAGTWGGPYPRSGMQRVRLSKQCSPTFCLG